MDASTLASLPAPPEPARWDAGDRAWIVSRYGEAVQVLRGRGTLVVDGAAPLDGLERRGFGFPALRQVVGGLPIFQNGAAHEASRGWLRAEVGRMLERWTPGAVAAEAERLVAALEGEADLMPALAEALPGAIVRGSLGLSAEEFAWLRAQGALITETWRAGLAMRDYQRLEPVAAGIAAFFGGRGQGEEAARAFFLVFAAVETTIAFLGNALHVLAHDGAMQARLRAEPALVPAFVEEALRWCGPLRRLSPRIAPGALQLGEAAIPEGAALIVRIESAHRDPEAFAQPDRFEIGRKGPAVMAFGAGAHACLGPVLARLESVALIGAVLARWRLEPGGEPVMRDGRDFRQFESLPVRLHRIAGA